MRLAEKIAYHRKAKDMTQDDLAEVLNVSRQSVSKWESGKAIPDLDKVIALAAVFSVTVDELVTDHPTPAPNPAEPAPYAPKGQRVWRIFAIVMTCVTLLCLTLLLCLTFVLQ